MTHRPRLLAPVASLLLLLSLAAPTGAMPKLLADSTSIERWKLDNGLEVAARHIPGVRAVAVTLGFRAGSGYDPPKQAGLAEVLADLAYYGPTPDIPERTPTEMPVLRPFGWGLQVNHRLSLLTDVVEREHLPGVLQQSAARLQGVVVTEAALSAARRRTTETTARRHFADPELVAWYRVGELARGITDEQLVDQSSGKTLAALRPREVQDALRRYYCPANGVLSLAGDLGGWDVHALVNAAFGSLSAGQALPEAPEPAEKAAGRVSSMPGLQAPRGAVALLGPSIEDTLHASFFLGALLIGSAFNQEYVDAGLGRGHFSYSLFDEPELVRLFPAIPDNAATLEAVDGEIKIRLDSIAEQFAGPSQIQDVRTSVEWLLGAAMGAGTLERVRSDTGGLGTLATGQATRVLWKGDAFWASYLARFKGPLGDHAFWLGRLASREHQARLLLVPSR